MAEKDSGGHVPLSSVQDGSCSGSQDRKKLPSYATQSSLAGPYPVLLEIREKYN